MKEFILITFFCFCNYFAYTQNVYVTPYGLVLGYRIKQIETVYSNVGKVKSTANSYGANQSISLVWFSMPFLLGYYYWEFNDANFHKFNRSFEAVPSLHVGSFQIVSVAF